MFLSNDGSKFLYFDGNVFDENTWKVSICLKRELCENRAFLDIIGS